MGVDCDIRFENVPDKIVYGGQQVAGIVDINAHKVTKVKKLVLYIEGIGSCEWKEGREVRSSVAGNHTEYTYYRGYDQYMNTITNLIANQTEIQPGRHTYNFMFQVPLGAPSSLQEENGKIYYRVRVVFDRPWKSNLEFDSEFTVVCPVDLNSNPGLRIPLYQGEIKHFCCLFCASDPVVLTATIPQAGYVVGQPIPVKVTINNPSNVDISHVELTLVKHLTYTSNCSRNYHGTCEVSRMVHGSSFSRCKKEYNIEMEVPHTVSSLNNPLVRVIKIHYSLDIKAKTPGCHKSLRVTFPITIGTIPLTQQNYVSNVTYTLQYVGGAMPPPTAPMNYIYSNTMPASAPINNIMMPPSAPMYNNFPNMMPPSAPQAPPDPDLPPPSFEESTKMMVPPEHPTGFAVPSNDVKKS